LDAVVTTENIESMVTLLLDHGVSPDVMQPLNDRKDYGVSPLFLAAE
jgi:hypothetical protein